MPEIAVSSSAFCLRSRVDFLFRLLVPFSLTILCLGPGSGLASGHAISKFGIELIAADPRGTVTPGEWFTLSLRLDPLERTFPDDMMAVVSSPHLPTRLSPFVYDEETGEMRVHIDIEAPATFPQSAEKNLLSLTCTAAQRKGSSLVTLAERAVYVTVGSQMSPSSGEPALSGPGADALLADMPPAERVKEIDSPSLAPALAPDYIEERPLVPAGTAGPAPGYWQKVKRHIIQSIREHRPPTLQERGLNAPTVHFRLYANGTAQTIQLDPGSGNPALDHALLLSVFHAQPFPPFPAEVTDPHLDVHMTIPPIPHR